MIDFSSIKAMLFDWDDSPYHKPDPRVFDLAFEKLLECNIKEDETVYIGDSRGILGLDKF